MPFYRDRVYPHLVSRLGARTGGRLPSAPGEQSPRWATLAPPRRSLSIPVN